MARLTLDYHQLSRLIVVITYSWFNNNNDNNNTSSSNNQQNHAHLIYYSCCYTCCCYILAVCSNASLTMATLATLASHIGWLVANWAFATQCCSLQANTHLTLGRKVFIPSLSGLVWPGTVCQEEQQTGIDQSIQFLGQAKFLGRVPCECCCYWELALDNGGTGSWSLLHHYYRYCCEYVESLQSCWSVEYIWNMFFCLGTFLHCQIYSDIVRLSILLTRIYFT